MKLYNSKTNSIEVFKPIHKDKVLMYVCGPTVYNYPHIGNARPIVVFDLLRRVLVALKYEVTMVSNFTDVDDRIIAKAQAEGVSEKDIAQRYIDAYNKVREGLNAQGVNATPKVTETMDSIITYIKDLVDKGFAYEVDGDVYFRVQKIEDYGSISSQNIDQLLVGARIEENTKKEDPLDFALWKVTDDSGIKWDSPWGKGRPGWHTECVVMIQDELEDIIDIHGGGQDLKFPHHENESAQCKAIHRHDLANYWVHNAMLNLDGVKMSKSLGNVEWAQDYIDRFGSNVTRWILLSTHYRLVLNITDSLVQQAQTEVQKLETVMNQTSRLMQLEGIPFGSDVDADIMDRFLEAMADDLNVANAQVVLFETVKQLNQVQRQKPIAREDIARLYETLKNMLDILGIIFDITYLTDEDVELFKQWNQAKAEKDFERADEVRSILNERGLLS